MAVRRTDGAALGVLVALLCASARAASPIAAQHAKKPASPIVAADGLLADGKGARALLLPDAEGHRLSLQNGTLAWLRAIPGPVAVVTAIGQYRSGKSYLLNQLMGVGCEQGFGVGHKRETQTKGVWAYAATPANGSGTTRLYLDTEGFDATGKAEVYDDRIFAFSALASSALLYNLVETIKEADIEKLAFVAQLATEFWRRTHAREDAAAARRSLSERTAAAQPPAVQPSQQQPGRGSGRGGSGGRRHASEWTPPALLWLVQRDFLEGSSVNDYLQRALQPVPHAPSDQHGERLNAIRASLAAFETLGRDGTGGSGSGGGGATGGSVGGVGGTLGGMAGMGLVQPHVRRTELCELSPTELAPEYLAGLRRVRGWVSQHASARGSRVWRSGAELAGQVSQLVNVLNAQRIPSAGSVIDAFNRELVTRTLAELRSSLSSLKLPLDTFELRAAADAAIGAARTTLRSEGFGAVSANGSGGAGDEFEAGARAAVRTLEDENFRASHELCKGLWDKCSTALDKLKLVTLPSRRRFRARLGECNATLVPCVGPAIAEYRSRLAEAASKGSAEYGDAFLQRLSHLLVICCVGGILLFRYVFENGLLELLCWLLLVTAEVLPRLNAVANFNPLQPDHSVSTTSFWDTPTGSIMLQVYEAAVFNEYADADDWIQIALILLLLLLAARQCYRSCCCESCGGGNADRSSRRRSRRDGTHGRHRRSASSRRMQVFSDDDDDELLADWGDQTSPKSNMPLRGKRSSSSGKRMLDL